MGNKEEVVLPCWSSDNSTVNTFSDFFMRKTAEIIDIIEADNSSMSETVVMDSGVGFEGQRITELEPSTRDEVRYVII